MLTYSESRGSFETEMFQQVIDINLFGSLYVAKHAAVAMARNKPIGDSKERGVIVFVSSVASFEGQRGQPAYSASKAALDGMALPMARDLGRYNIRVASIAPGIMWSPMSDKMQEKNKKALLADTPMGRMGKPLEFA